MSFEKSPHEFPPEITIDGENFSFLKTRDFGQGVLYSNSERYLRIGEAGLIGHELEVHRAFEDLGFPVAKILSEGTYKEYSYYSEESIGNMTFHEIFRAETQKNNKITNETFNAFLKIIEKCVKGQVAKATLPTEEDVEAYFKTWFFDDVSKEVPHLEAHFAAAKKKARNTLNIFPAVLSHNDFNAYNILPAGIIDFAYGQKMPLGYDWVSLVTHQNFFPVEDGFEERQKYAFTLEQQADLKSLFTEALQEMGLKFEDIFSTLFLGRMIWSAAHMGKYSKIQRWRFEKLEAMLEDYLGDS